MRAGRRGRAGSVVEIARDITALKRAEVELQRHAAELEEANRIKDLFADVMSHDLLNPAPAASFFLEYLPEGESSPERVRLIETVERNVDKLIRMIQNAFSCSKLQEMREIDMKVEDPGGIVREVLADLETQVRAGGMSVDGPTEGRHLVALNPLFAHDVANLVGNAVKNAGLGLAIASRIVGLHGGRIWVEDIPGGGSVFLVALPKAHDIRQNPVVSQESRRPPAR